MARSSYDFNFNNNFNIQKGAPLDSRIVVEYLSDLISDNEYNEDGSIKTLSAWSNDAGIKYLYNGLVVSVLEDNSLYMLTDYKKQANADFSGWLRLDRNAYDVNIIKNPNFSSTVQGVIPPGVTNAIPNWTIINEGSNGIITTTNGAFFTILNMGLSQKVKLSNNGNYIIELSVAAATSGNANVMLYLGENVSNVTLNGETAVYDGYLQIKPTVSFKTYTIRFKSTKESITPIKLSFIGSTHTNIRFIELREISPYKLESGLTIKTINGQPILGSGNITIDGNSIGLGTALYYLGVTETNLSDESTSPVVVINGVSKTATSGAVVFYDNKEFIFNGERWEELGYPTNLDKKQDELISGQNIKTINGETLLGPGNITIKSTYDTTLLETTEAPLKVGGIDEGTIITELKNKSFIELFDELIFPVDKPTHTDPSIYDVIFETGDGLTEIVEDSMVIKVGTSIKYGTCSFDKGTWTKYNDNTNYAGKFQYEEYDFNINGNRYTKPELAPTILETPGDHTYNISITLGSNIAPFDNRGNKCDELSYPGGTITTTKTINASYPYYLYFTDNYYSGTETEFLDKCKANGNGTHTIEMSAFNDIKHIPSIKMGSNVTPLFKVRGNLEIKVVDPFGELDENGVACSVLELIPGDTSTDGYTTYSYPKTVSKGKVKIHSGKITF